MNNYKKHFIFLFLCISSIGLGSDLYAQTDYIINNDNAKIMGEVKSHNVDKVKFIPAGEKKVQKFNAEQLKEVYQAGHGVYRSIVREEGGSPSFLQVLEDGKIKLYEYYQAGSTMYSAPMAGGGMGFVGGSGPKKRWYAQKDGGAVADIKSNGIWGSRKDRKDNFLNMIKDNPHVAERYAKADKFSFDFVRSLIVEYNDLKAKEGQK